MRKLILGGFGALAMVGAFAAPASADVGDGRLACSSGEICFTRDLTTNFQKHFWAAGWHTDYTFTDVRNGNGGQGAVRDNAEMIRNRDTRCNVKVVNDHGVLPDQHRTYVNDGTWYILHNEVLNKQDRHERC
jgi:transposase